MALPRTLNEAVEKGIDTYLETVNKDPSKLSFFAHAAQKILGHGQEGRDRAALYKHYADIMATDDLLRAIYIDLFSGKPITALKGTSTSDILVNILKSYLDITPGEFEAAKKAEYIAYTKMMTTTSGPAMSDEMIAAAALLSVTKKKIELKKLANPSDLAAVRKRMQAEKDALNQKSVHVARMGSFQNDL